MDIDENFSVVKETLAESSSGLTGREVNNTEALSYPKDRQFHMILLGDVREALKRMPDESVDLIMTSPPY